MINIILLICCILVGFLLGIVVRKQVVSSAELFSDAVKYVELFRLNVSGKRLEVTQFNAEFLQDCSESFGRYLEKREGRRMSSQHKKHLQEFFDNLDCASGEAVLQHLDFYEKIFREDWDACRALATKSSLYVKLGLLLGAMIGILFL